MLISNGTMRAIPLQVTVLGPPKAGRNTFLRSLESNESRKIGPHSIEIQVRDIANNIQLDLNFVKQGDFDSSACILLMFDVGDAGSFQHATEVLYPALKE